MNTLFYDQKCDFCTRIVRSISNKSDEIQLRTLQSIHEGDSQFNEIELETILSAMWLYNEDNNELLSGYFAFKRIVLLYYKNPGLRFIFKTPISDFFGKRLYKIVAKNRKLAGCNSNSCGLH
jgi:predicted DCC family thiol-disulfide oxidoreductase YuxK